MTKPVNPEAMNAILRIDSSGDEAPVTLAPVADPAFFTPSAAV